MKKPRPSQKHKMPKQQPAPLPQPEIQSLSPSKSPEETRPKSLLGRATKAWAAIVAAGWFGGILNLADQAWNTLVVQTEPTIQAPTSGADQFSLPFSIKNNSAFFTMRDTKWICNVNDVTIGRTHFENFTFEFGSVNKSDVLPGHVLLGKCPINADPKKPTTISPAVQYKTFLFTRIYRDAVFTWLPKSNPPQWITGTPAELGAD